MTLPVVGVIIFQVTDHADLAAKVAALEERMETKQAQSDARMEKLVNVVTWRMIIFIGLIAGVAIAAVRL